MRIVELFIVSMFIANVRAGVLFTRKCNRTFRKNIISIISTSTDERESASDRENKYYLKYS